MKKIFKKAMTVLGGVAMIGATVSVASAAAFPEPFTSNTAIVVGANAAATDSSSASKILTELNKNAAATSANSAKVTIDEDSADGDVFKIEKSSTKFHIGDLIKTVYSSDLDEDELPNLLMDGKYQDTNNDEFDYTQKITLANKALTMFDDNDYKEDAPTLGFKYSSGEGVMAYTLDFTDMPDFADMASTNIQMMGKEYYVLSAPTTNDKLTLLDSANTEILTEGDTKPITVGGTQYDVSIEFVSSSEAKLKVNGEVTNTLNEGETYKLDNGAYVGLKDILYSAKDTGISKVEFSIGKGKLVLENGQEVVMNDDTINGLDVTIVNSSLDLDSVTINWTADNDLFVAEDSMITMPGFEAVKLSFTGVEYPAEEEIKVAVSGEYAYLSNFPTKDSVDDIPLLYTNGTVYKYIGKDSTNQLVTGTTSIIFDGDDDDMFIATYDDTNDAESYVMRATSFKTDNGVNKTTIQYSKDGDWVDVKGDVKATDTVSLGSVELTIGAIAKDAKTVNITRGSTTTNFDTLYSREGLKVYLPVDRGVASTAYGSINLTDVSGAVTSFPLVMIEEDKNENKAGGDAFNVTIGLNTESVKEPTVSDIVGEEVTFAEIGNTDVYRSFMYSALGTELLWDKSASAQKELDIIYHGEEARAQVFVTAPSVGMTTGTETGIMSVKDSETDKYTGKHMVVVGGSAINTVAADLLGGAYSEAKFTEMTGVAAGEFLIQSFDKSGKTALLVAGYNAADTVKAVDYLVNFQDQVDTTVGNKYKGNSATKADIVVN